LVEVRSDRLTRVAFTCIGQHRGGEAVGDGPEYR
jgi:hypothetical protein